MRLFILLGVCTLACPALAEAKDLSRSAKLSKGTAKVVFSAAAVEASPEHASHTPRIGIAPSPSSTFGNFLARSLEQAGRTVIPSTRLSAGLAFTTGSDQLLRSELISLVSATCRQGKLDYLLVMGAPQSSSKTDITAMIFFVGKMRMRNRQESRLYDCRTSKTVWAQNVLFETSQGVVSAGFGGIGAGFLGGPEAEKAMAGIYAEKLTADMGW